MKGKKIAITIAAVMAVSLILMAPVNAATFPNVPGTPVTLTLTLVPGHWPGTIVFSGIPAGGYDVKNGVPYTAWCDQLFNFITPGTPYTATLVSSVGRPSPWPEINYLLNHNSGEDMDVQFAIWLLCGFTPADIASRGYVLTAEGTALYNAAKTQTTFVPVEGELVAVECVTNGNTQDVLIQLRIPEAGYTPGFWKHNIGVALGYNPGAYSAFNDGTKLTKAMLEGYAATVGVTLQEAYDALNTKGQPASTRIDMANAFNAAAGYGPFVD